MGLQIKAGGIVLSLKYRDTMWLKIIVYFRVFKRTINGGYGTKMGGYGTYKNSSCWAIMSLVHV
jgi:hypothetical protein